MDKKTNVLETFVVFDVSAGLRELVSLWGYNLKALTVAEKAEIGERLSVYAGKKPAWGRIYITNLLNKKINASDKMRETVMGLLTIEDGAKIEQVKSHAVTVQALGNVREGALIFGDSKPCENPHCPIHFVGPKNKRYHSTACRQAWKKEQRKNR